MAGQVLTAFDTATGGILGTVTPPVPAGSYSFVGSAISADGGTLYASYAAQIGTGAGLATIATASLTVTGSASLGSELQQPVLAKDGATLYVPDAIDSLVYVVNAANLTATASIAVQGPVASATLSRDGSALYVPNASTARTLAVDTSSLAVVQSISVGGTAIPRSGWVGQRAPAQRATGAGSLLPGFNPTAFPRSVRQLTKPRALIQPALRAPRLPGSSPRP